MSITALKTPDAAGRVRHELVALDRLTIDARVQRIEGVHATRAQSIADTFNPDALGTITLSRRENGAMVILDGAHRCEACRLVGYPAPLHALVYEGLTLAQEAAMFNLLNTFKQPSYISRTLARVVAGDAVATDVVRTIERHGWKIARGHENASFAAVSAAERVYTTGAGSLPAGNYPEVLDRTMALITGAWRHDRESAHQTIVQGVGQVFGRFGDAVDIVKLSTSLSQERPNAIIARARAYQSAQGGTTPAALAKVLVGVHNRGKRSRLLPDWVWTR